MLGMFQCLSKIVRFEEAKYLERHLVTERRFQAVPGRSVDIRTSPEQSEELGVWLEKQGITWSVMIEDVGFLVEAEKVRVLALRNISLISPSG